MRSVSRFIPSHLLPAPCGSRLDANIHLDAVKPAMALASGYWATAQHFNC